MDLILISLGIAGVVIILLVLYMLSDICCASSPSPYGPDYESNSPVESEFSSYSYSMDFLRKGRRPLTLSLGGESNRTSATMGYSEASTGVLSPMSEPLTPSLIFTPSEDESTINSISKESESLGRMDFGGGRGNKLPV